jgi:hypothetical protein
MLIGKAGAAMIHIIGVSHSVQSKPEGAEDTLDQVKYRQVLSEAISQIKPTVVAEEFSQSVLDKKRAERIASGLSAVAEISITKVCAGHKHRFCDLPILEREAMGYPDHIDLVFNLMMNENYSQQEAQDRAIAIEMAKWWPIRERYWLSQLKDVAQTDVLFVVGDAHVDTLKELLSESGIGSSVIARNLGTTARDVDLYERGKRYLEGHPEVQKS